MSAQSSTVISATVFGLAAMIVAVAVGRAALNAWRKARFKQRRAAYLDDCPLPRLTEEESVPRAPRPRTRSQPEPAMQPARARAAVPLLAQILGVGTGPPKQRRR